MFGKKYKLNFPLRNMLKRGFYDIITVIGFVLVVAISFLISGVTFSKLTEGGITLAANALLMFQLLIGAIIFIYWLFILMLAINLYGKGLLISIEVVLVAVMLPFSPILYLILLRSPLKGYHEDNPHAKKKLGNVPGSP